LDLFVYRKSLFNELGCKKSYARMDLSTKMLPECCPTTEQKGIGMSRCERLSYKLYGTANLTLAGRQNTAGQVIRGKIKEEMELFAGNDSNASQIWLVRNKLQPQMNAEERTSIRAVRRAYAKQAGMAFEQVPDPRGIEDITLGKAPGNMEAMVEAYRQPQQVVGDALTLIDGLAVIGSGVSKGWRLFLPALLDELNTLYTGPSGNQPRCLPEAAFILEDAAQPKKFLKEQTRTVTVPDSKSKIKYDSLQRIGAGVSRLAPAKLSPPALYAFALQKFNAN
jgi:glucokinase